MRSTSTHAAPICLVVDAEEADLIASALEDAIAAAPEEHSHSIDLAGALRRVQEAITQTGPSFDPTARRDGAEPAPPAFHPPAGSGAIDDAGSPWPERDPSPPSPGPTAAGGNPAAVAPITDAAAEVLSRAPGHWVRALAKSLLAEREAHTAVVLSLGGMLARAIAEADQLRAERDRLASRPADGDYWPTLAARDHAVVVLRHSIPGLTVEHATRMARALGIGPED